MAAVGLTCDPVVTPPTKKFAKYEGPNNLFLIRSYDEIIEVNKIYHIIVVDLQLLSFELIPFTFFFVMSILRFFTKKISKISFWEAPLAEAVRFTCTFSRWPLFLPLEFYCLHFYDLSLSIDL